MGLLDNLNNGVTSLKSIPFGGDQPGGGNSKQPYIRKSIDEKQTNPAYNNEFIVRGGIEAPLSAGEDVVRLSKYFIDVQNPQGLLFVAKQNILSRTGTKTEASKGLGYAGGALNEGAYTPLSTLAQAGVGFLGIHLNKQGIDPTGLIPSLDIKKYQDVIIEDQLTGNIDLNNNRLVRLVDAITNNKGVNNFNGVVGYALNPSQENDVLLSYGGGSDSILGIGKTKIKFATNNDGNPIKTLTPPLRAYTTGQPYAYIDRDKFQIPIAASSTYNSFIDSFSKSYIPYDLTNNGRTFYQEKDVIPSVYQLGSLKSNDNIGVGSWTQQDFINQPLDLNEDIKPDFREKLDINAGKTFLSVTKGYKANNIEDKFGMGNPGNRLRNRSNPFSGSIIPGQITSEPLDKVTAYPIYKLNTNKPILYGRESDLNDLIQFSIAILNNDNQNKAKDNPEFTTPTNYTYKKYMHFRAFIDNISDSYNAEWKDIEYMGRAEKFYKYGGFSRKMSLAFTVVAQSKDELNVMYDKLNFLASSLAPEYLDSKTSGYMAGNIAYITLGDYINDQPGVITGLDFDIPEDSPWEINRDGKSLRQLPHMIKVKVDFTPIQKFRPEKQSWKNVWSKTGTGIADSETLIDPGNQRYIDSNNPFNAKTTKYSPTQQFATDSLNPTQQIAINTNTQENIIVTQAAISQNNNDLSPGGGNGLVFPQ